VAQKLIHELGAAFQVDGQSASLAALIASLDRTRLLDMAKKARALGKPDAARIVAQRCMEIAR
jgi:UDP-N-acetylglucosamine--N-acetylmuramyl-(pentapeptide) pyrophosphoryl-undecaprenol N-acetylglucosamine transferase